MDLKVVSAGVAGLLTACGIAQAQVFLIDFGNASGATASDGGNTWNSFAPGGFIRLDDTDGNRTAGSIVGFGIGMGATTGVGQSASNEGLLSPDPAGLGNLAVESATADFIFQFQGTVGLEFSLVDRNLEFRFELFGSRAFGDPAGSTRYTVTGAGGAQSAVLSTGDNGDMVATIDGIFARDNETILLELSNETGDFAFLNAMRITVVPAPAAAGVAAFGALAAVRRRR